jgi:APA family basic amino acid/polyamine antiporter
MSSQLFLKKSVQRIQQEGMQSQLKRSLGPWNLVSLGIGCIIGAGIFVMTGKAAAEHAGPALLISFIFTGLACAFVGLCYAEMASVLPISGSAYTYAYATLGEMFAWVMGWLLVLEYGVAASTVAVGWAGYINSFLMGMGVLLPPELTVAPGQALTISELYQPLFAAAGYSFDADKQLLDAAGNVVHGVFNLPAFIGVGLVTALLVIGVSESAKVNNVIVFIKVAVVLLFIGIGVFYVDPANWNPFIPMNEGPGKYGWDGIFRAAGIIFFAYVGFEAVSTAAQEAKNPQKDMPFGILVSLLICTLLYMAVSAVLTGLVPFKDLNVADPMAVAVDHIGLAWFAFLIKVGAITGLTSVMLVLLYGQTRIFYVMSRDGLLPQAFCKVHARFKTPHINTLCIGALVAIAAGMTPISLLGDLVSLGTLLAFMIVCFSVLYLRRAQPDLHRPFRTPFAPFVPVMGILTCGYLILTMFLSFQDFDEAYYTGQHPEVVQMVEEGKYESALDHFLKVGSKKKIYSEWMPVDPAYPEQAISHPVLKDSGRDILIYIPPYLLAGALIYILYGYRNSRLAHGGKPLDGDPEFVTHEHEPQTE